MTTRDLLRLSLASPSLAPAVRVNGTATGAAVDLINFDGAMIVVHFGAYTDGTHTPSVTHSADNVTFTAVTPATDLDGAFTAVSSAGGANTMQQVGYIGSQRYVKVVMTTTGATTGAASQASVFAGYPHTAPTQ